MSTEQQTPETTHTPHTWERKLGYEIISWDGFRDLKNTDLITETDFRKRAVHTTQNLLSPAQQIYRLTTERDAARAEATEANEWKVIWRDEQKALRSEVARLTGERDDEISENESSLRGRMEYLAEMGFPYGCTWDEAIYAQKLLRAELATLRATRDADHATIDAAAAACANDLQLTSAKGIIATHMRTLGCPQVDHGAAIEAAARRIDDWESPLIVLRALVATVTNSQQKGGDEPCAQIHVGDAAESTEHTPTTADLPVSASNAAPTSDPEGAATRSLVGPITVCLCGSSKWPWIHMRVMMEETLAGRIVIPMGLYGHADFPAGAKAATNDGDEATEVKQMLDRLHFAKIDKSDEIVVVRVCGYIGSSTAREIAYAESKGKKVRFWDEKNPLEECPHCNGTGFTTGESGADQCLHCWGKGTFDSQPPTTPLSSVTEAAKEIARKIHEHYKRAIATMFGEMPARDGENTIRLIAGDIESILSRFLGAQVGSNLRLQQELSDWMKIAEMEGEKRESLEETLGARELEIRELRAECERFREKLREILLAANLEQQTEGVVQPFVAKWIRKRTAECERLREDKERLREVVEKFLKKAQVFGMAGATNHPAVKCEVKGLTLADFYTLSAAMQPSPKSPLDEPAKH